MINIIEQYGYLVFIVIFTSYWDIPIFCFSISVVFQCLLILYFKEKMNTAPQFSLRWNNYVNHVTDAFNILRLENDLVDVTLCCEGGKIKAHRVLLSACSVYFKQIFKENPCQHPVIIFKNVKFEDLTAIINFMYHGEVNILQEQLESFLITAEMLQVKGLTDGVDDENSKVQNVTKDNISLDLTARPRLEDPVQNVTIEEPINLAPVQSKEENIPFTIFLPENDGTETRPDDSTDETPSKRKSTGPQTEDMQIDNQNSNIDDSERNTNESELAKFWCQLCPKGFKHPTSLTLHKDSHAGKTQCPVCYRSFSRSYDMRSHLQRIHQGKQLTIKEIRYKSTNDSIAPKPFTHNI